MWRSGEGAPAVDPLSALDCAVKRVGVGVEGGHRGASQSLVPASAMKRAVPSGEAYAISSDSSCSETEADGSARKKRNSKAQVISVKDAGPEGVLVRAIISKADPLSRKAEMYQEYMRTIPIPRYQGSIIPFKSWQGLAKSMKQIYGQPLHYLTNVLLKQWDQLRAGTEDEHLRLDTIIHPAKAEGLIWVTEEVQRLTCSPHYLANLWASDPMYHAFIDSVFPNMMAVAQETHV
ncbi:hypothetical protein Taro_010529 [Colocasia esculenta]|uniref:Protein RDM1 n=1 Tax=Colocasia esculenta TaxID=4460 RepID=A0A843U3B0_COLES|nr:hypothetical protein [Colocasia esculenta]